MNVGHNKVFGIVILVLAVACLVLGFLARTPMTSVVGGFNTVLGVLYLNRPYFVVGPHAIELKNLLGMTMRRIEYGNFSELEVGPDELVYHVFPDGQKTRLKLSRWVADRRDWRKFLGLVQARTFD